MELNGYELSRNWFDFCFENTDQIKPIHSALYFFAIEHCNRLGWKDKFGLPTQMAMDAIGVKNWRTYSAAFEDLVIWKFFIVYQRSKNQYSATVIGIVKNTKANTKALSKAMQKHSQKHSSSIAVINKPYNHITNKPINTTVGVDVEKQISILSFDDFWELYDKKTGDKKKIQKKYNKLSEEVRQKIIEHVPAYKLAQPDKQYRKNPETYINQESWNDEIINRNGTNKFNSKQSTSRESKRMDSFEEKNYEAQFFQ